MADPFELLTFASGDTDYIPKLNQNSAEIEAAINALQTQVGAVAGGDALSLGMFYATLFNNADALIGVGSYAASLSASTLTVAPGGMYLGATQKIVTSLSSTPLSFAGQASGTYYIIVNASGIPTRSSTTGAGAIYSVVWNGSSFGGPVSYIAAVFYDANEAANSRRSLALGSPPNEIGYPSLDARLENSESITKTARTMAGQALAIAQDLQSRTSVRKVGVTVDGTSGVKGAIQIDFDGTIIGWSCIADAVGSLQVEVSVKANSIPPAVPLIPDPVTDKITAAAPITLTSAQSASSGTAGVSTWTTNLTRWSVVQFKVATVTTIARATLYLRIQEIIPVINPLDSPPEEEEEEEDLEEIA